MKGKSKCKVINNGFSQAKSDTRNKSSESDLGHGLVIFGIVLGCTLILLPHIRGKRQQWF